MTNIGFLVYRKALKNSMMRSALAEHIIQLIKSLRRPFILASLAVLAAYFSLKILSVVDLSSYFKSFSIFLFLASLSNSPLDLPKERGNSESHHLKDHLENLVGDGPKVAAYLRVSTKRQAKEGYSLEAQYEQLSELKNKIKPSCIHWFIDPGKSASRDFDKRKMNAILKLRESGKIQQLWVWNVGRMGRECRRLLYFFLDFCDNGAKIVTPEREYSLKDLASLITFIIDAHSAEKANKDRTAAAIAGKAQAFKQRHWNKPVPLGYLKDVWLKKIAEYESLINEAYRLWLSRRSMESVKWQLNKVFRQVLSKPLTRGNVKRILSDPVYIGRPTHLGEVVIDPSLAFVDEGEFQKSLAIFATIRDRHKPRRVGPLELMANAQPIAFLEMLQIFDLHHPGCGGLVRKNGTAYDNGPWQQLLKCKACPAEWRLPPIKQRTEIRLRSNSGENAMGKLVFDHGLVPERNETTNNISKEDASSKKRFTESLAAFTEESEHCCGASSDHERDTRAAVG